METALTLPGLDILAELEALPIFENREIYHGEFQLRNFVISPVDHPTPAGRYHQCVRELQSRKDNIRTLQHQHTKLSLSNERFKLLISSEQSKLHSWFASASRKAHAKIAIATATADINYNKSALSAIDFKIANKVRECKFLLTILQECLAEISPDLLEENGFPSTRLSDKEYWITKQIVTQKLNPKLMPFAYKVNSIAELEEVLNSQEARDARIIGNRPQQTLEGRKKLQAQKPPQ